MKCLYLISIALSMSACSTTAQIASPPQVIMDEPIESAPVEEHRQPAAKPNDKLIDQATRATERASRRLDWLGVPTNKAVGP